MSPYKSTTDELRMSEHSEDMNQIEYKEWKIDKLNDASFMTIDWLKGS